MEAKMLLLYCRAPEEEKAVPPRNPAAQNTQRKRKLSELKEIIEQVCLITHKKKKQFVELNFYTCEIKCLYCFYSGKFAPGAS